MTEADEERCMELGGKYGGWVINNAPPNMVKLMRESSLFSRAAVQSKYQTFEEYETAIYDSMAAIKKILGIQ